MRRMRHYPVALAVLSVLPWFKSEARAADVTPARIVQVWAEREKRIRTCRIQWSETETLPKGSTFVALREDPTKLPMTDLTLQAKCSLTLGEGKSRYEYRGQVWSTKTKGLAPLTRIVTFDGSRAGTSLLQSPLVGHPEVTIKKTSLPGQPLPVLLPLWITARGSFAKSDLPIEQFRPSGRTAIIKGRKCVELDRDSSEQVREQVFIDPDQDYQVARYMYYNNGKLKIKLDISLQHDQDVGWIPASWDCLLCNRNGAIESSVRCTVTEFVANLEISSSDFDPVTPPGSRVVDLTSGREIHHAVLPSGEPGKAIEYAPGRGGIPYEELMAQPPQRSQRLLMQWILGALTAGLFIVLLVVVRVRLRRRRLTGRV